MIDKNELLKLLPKLIREDDEIKGAIITALSGVVATKEDIIRIIEHSDRRFEAVDKRFEAMDKRFETLQEQMNNRFEAVDKRFEAVDNRFEALIKEMNKGFEIAREERVQLQASINSLGRRGGIGLENAILYFLNDNLIQESINTSEIKKEKLNDKEGKVFWENYSTDIDILIQNNKTILIEIKFHADNRDAYQLIKKAELYKYQFNRNYDELMIICLEITQNNYEQIVKQGIKVIAGKIV